MTSAVPDILARIVQHKRQELARATGTLESLEVLGEQRIADRRPFAASLSGIIAESKKASPSKGVLAQAYDPGQRAKAYEAGGAVAISVLTDSEFFQGHLSHLREARAAVRLPVLRKDFIISRYHVAEAAANCADAILLITAILSDAELRDFREYAEQFRMDVLVEVHDDKELARAVASGAKIIGVNNRDLRTFTVSLQTSLRLIVKFPAGILAVAESGIQTRADLAVLRQAGYSAFLIGERLMQSGDPAAAIRELLG